MTSQQHKDVRFEFDISVVQGQLDHEGGVTVPFQLIAALQAATQGQQVEDLDPGNDTAKQDRQSQLFADKLREIWNNLGGVISDYRLSADYEPTTGARPPWKRGGGAMFDLLEFDPGTQQTRDTFEFTNHPATPAQSVTVKFRLSLQFVTP